MKTILKTVEVVSTTFAFAAWFTIHMGLAALLYGTGIWLAAKLVHML